MFRSMMMKRLSSSVRSAPRRPRVCSFFLGGSYQVRKAVLCCFKKLQTMASRSWNCKDAQIAVSIRGHCPAAPAPFRLLGQAHGVAVGGLLCSSTLEGVSLASPQGSIESEVLNNFYTGFPNKPRPQTPGVCGSEEATPHGKLEPFVIKPG